MNPYCIPVNNIRLMMICEAAPENPADYFYTSRDSLYVTNTLAAFNAAGIPVTSINDVIQRGVYLTVAVRAPRQGLTVPTEVIREHAADLLSEFHMFPNLKVILLMGDTAIKALNLISQYLYHTKVIPSGATYKIRGGTFWFNSIRVFPSYLQTGKNFLIEKAKRMMVAEDLQNAFKFIENSA
jgi:uracil-DNA glycosylase